MMRYNILLATLSLVACVSAQSYEEPPSCSLSCFSTYLPGTGCSSSDVKCLCMNVSYRENVGTCAYNACSTADYNLLVSTSTYNCQLALDSFVTTTASPTSVPSYAYPTDNPSSDGGSKDKIKPHKTSRLSSGSKYGLGFGIPGAVVALVGALFGLYKKRKQKKANAQSTTGVTQIQEQSKMDHQPTMWQPQQPVVSPVQQPVAQQTYWAPQNEQRYEAGGKETGYAMQATAPAPPAELPNHVA